MKKLIFVFWGLMLLISPVIAEPTTDDIWHQFHKDVAHTGAQTTGPNTSYIAWSSGPVDAISDSSVVIAKNKAFVNCFKQVGPDTYSWIKALNMTDGNVEWSTELDAQEWSSWSTPAYHDGRVFTSSGQNTTCLYASNGSIIWEFENPTGEASCNGGPTIADGKVFCNDWQGGNYYCLNETDGTEIWNFSVYDSGGTGLNGPRAQGCVAYKDGMAYLTSYSYQHMENGSLTQGFVYCVDAETGEEEWRTKMEQNACGSVMCGDDDRVYVTTYNFYGNGATYALNATNGSIIWERETWRTDSTPTLAYGNVYIAGGYEWGKAYCFNASNGTTVWETDGSLWIGHWTQSVAVADGKMYVGRGTIGGEMIGGYDGLYALDAFTGEIRWVSPYGGSSPAISDGKLVTIDTDRVVYCYDGSNLSVDPTSTSLDLTTPDAYADTPNEITVTIENLGTSYASNVKVSLLDGGTEIDNQTVNVAGGWSKSLTFIWTPTAAQAGVHTLYVSVDPQDAITESNETNNILSDQIYVMDGGCDLTPISVTPDEIYVNQTYNLTATVNNIGYKNSVPCKVTVKQGSTVIANVTLPAISPGTTGDASFSWLPASTGDVTLTLIVDSDDENEELLEDNNELAPVVMVRPESAIETLSGDDWVQFQNQWNNLGLTASYAPMDEDVALEWSANLSSEYVDSPPIVAEDIVYVYTSAGSLYAYDKYDGAFLWKKGLEPAVIQSSTPAYGDGNIFVASKAGNLTAYDAETGIMQWTVDATDIGFESPITYFDHRIYIGDGLGQGVETKYYHCYDDLGNHLWSYPNTDSAGFIWNGASVVGDYVVYPTQEGKLVCLDRKNGTLVDAVSLDSDVSSRISFASETPGLFRSSVVYEDGYIYTTSEQGQDLGFLWKVGFDTGTFQNKGWSMMQGFSTSTPVIHDGRIYVGQGEHGYPGKLNCVNDSTGALIWSYDVPRGVKSSPAVSTYYGKPFIYFTSAMNNGSLYCLDENGTFIWEYNPPEDNGYVLQGAAISQGKVYFGTDGGYLYCIDGGWNLFNDELSEGGALVSNSEIQYAVFKWKKQSLLDTGYVISNSDIQLLVFKWKKQTPM
jgi:outer membrane protein assembly factor BamB